MRILGKIISVLYSIVFIALLFSLTILIYASNLLKGEFYTNVLENVDLKEISASDIGLSENKDDTLEDVLVNQLTDAGLDKNVSKTILNNKEIKEVVGNVIGQVINYSINKKEAPKITEKQVEKILNNKDVQKLLEGNEFSKNDLKELTNELNKFLKEFADNGGLNGN